MPHNFRAFSSFGFSIPHCCFSFSFELLQTFRTKLVPTDDQDLWLHVFFVSGPPDHRDPSRSRSLNIENCVKPVHGSDKFRLPSVFPTIIYTAFLQHIQGRVNVSQWYWERCFLWHVELNSRFDVMTINVINSLRWTKNLFGLHCHPSLCPVVETRPTLLEDHF